MTGPTQDEFQISATKHMGRIKMLMETKGLQYSGSPLDLALANFIDGSHTVGLSPILYLMALATKQWYAVCRFAHRPMLNRVEEIQERIDDIVIYMLLLSFMLDVDLRNQEE